MPLRPPAAIDDFGSTVEEQQLRANFEALWNDPNGKFLGTYASAVGSRPNYVDPRVTPPTTGPASVPWNGFPKLLSRWFDDETNTAQQEQAEIGADVLVPKWSWVQPVTSEELSVFSCAPHQVPFYASIFGEHVTQLARPRRLVNPDNTIGAELAELYRQQDEYLEWFAKRDANGKLLELHFTAEPPDYWEALALVSKEKVLKLYEDILHHPVAEDEVFYPADVATVGIDTEGNVGWYVTSAKGGYNRLNPWTTTKGIIHLTHWANTLGAEVNLAKEASSALDCDSLPAPGHNDPPVEVRRIACGGYGGINRSSDPLIGLGVGDHVSDGSRVTLTDPVGLYILRCDLAGLTGPGGEVVGDHAQTLVRGDGNAAEPRGLRVEIKAPAGAAFVLGDCTLGGRALKRGGQIARKTTMGLYAQVYPDSADATALPCEAIPCRNPALATHFISSRKNQQNQDVCPTQGSPLWLIERPYLPAAGAGLAPAGQKHIAGAPIGGAALKPRPQSRSPLRT